MRNLYWEVNKVELGKSKKSRLGSVTSHIQVNGLNKMAHGILRCDLRSVAVFENKSGEVYMHSNR